MNKQLWAALLTGAAVSIQAAGDLEDLRGLILTNAKLPLYNKQVLQSMVFCDKAERQGKLVVGQNVVLDLVRRTADVDEIKDGWGVKFYPLGAKLPEIFNFWKGRLYSEGVMFTPRADIEQETKMAAGGEPVYFRSPVIDLDGVGFEADLDKKTILVKSDVRIVLRMGGSDPRKLFEAGAKLPPKYEYMTATSDSMLIDMNNNQILLIGNVRVDEENSGVDCDRMTIFIDRRSDQELAGANRTAPVNAEDTLEGVSRILCDGNVVVSRKLTAEEAKEGDQKAFADHMVYDVKTASVTLTGEEKKNPRVIRGQESLTGQRIVMFREEQRATVTGDCEILVIQEPENPGDKPGVMKVNSDIAQMDYRNNYSDFIGNVKVDEPRMTLECDKMRVTLRELASGPAVESVGDTASLSGLPDFGTTGGKRELDKIKCSGRVKMVRKDDAGKLMPDQKAEASFADFNYADRTVRMYGGEPKLTRGLEEMSGRELLIWINEERLAAKEESKIVLCSAPAEGAKEQAPSQTVITSDESDLNYGGNSLVFTGNVQVRDPRMILDCDRMELVMMPRESVAKAEKKDPAKKADELGGASESKFLSKVICTGNVHAVEDRMDLKTDKLTLLFRELPPGTVVEPGMFQSNGTQLTKILCDGRVVMVNQPDPDAEKKSAEARPGALSGMFGNSKSARTLKSGHAVVDMLKNESEFHEKVEMVDDQGTLKCEDMFVYAEKSAPAAAQTAAKSAAKPHSPDLPPDDDGFAVEESGSEVPERIELAEGLELSRILCLKDVELTRRTKTGEVQRAGGQKADYVVADKKIIMTGDDREKPWMSASGGRLKGKRIIVYVDSERMEVDGGTQVDFSNGINFPAN
ncbi:LptA/OstA family protein [uncultured Victivallis sp.]|uniref:LptA/OstA family protein n=1 Tax=uncultured Victivallis sp. TaxID=354118 RepID=UPI002599F5EB|nr:LptA/OstA family protein [uncultured Victivallis sp.]